MVPVHHRFYGPGFALDRNDIADPVAHLTENQTYVMKTFTEEGCFDYDTINIKVFNGARYLCTQCVYPRCSTNNIFRPIPVVFPKLNISGSITEWYACVFYQPDGCRLGWNT
jgi:hypothetical protein